jgi:hypothetical protein
MWSSFVVLGTSGTDAHPTRDVVNAKTTNALMEANDQAEARQTNRSEVKHRRDPTSPAAGCWRLSLAVDIVDQVQ